MKYLILILIFKSILFFLWIPESGIGLSPDEAQYWTWSKQLDWGYYSKPPGIAWQIWLGTTLFGDTELGVRFMSILISGGLSLAVYALAKSCKLENDKCVLAGIVTALTPIGMFSSLLATTDGGMLLFWTLGLAASNPYISGLMILLGALFKWPIYLLWIPLAIFRKRDKHLLFAMLLSCLGLLPSLIWNYSHEWVTFKHVFAQSTGGNHPALKGNFFEFLGAQILLLGPILFVLLVIAFLNLRKVSRPLFMCGAISLSIFSVFLGMSLFTKIQGNWCIFAYPTAIVFLTAFASRFWVMTGTLLSFVMCLAVLAIPFLEVPYKYNPLRHTMGWNQIKGALEGSGYDPKTDVLFGDKYQTTSILSFYGPEQHRAYFLNLLGVRKNQFSFWPKMPEGSTGYFVVLENPNKYLALLQKYFIEVEYKGSYPLVGEKKAYIFKCTGYNGLEPVDPNLY